MTNELQTAITTVQHAIDADTNHQYQRAIALYDRSLELFNVALTSMITHSLQCITR
jgi:hypothetical protein